MSIPVVEKPRLRSFISSLIYERFAGLKAALKAGMRCSVPVVEEPVLRYYFFMIYEWFAGSTAGLKIRMRCSIPTDDEIDLAQLVKIYSAETGTSSTERKYSPCKCTGSKKTVIYEHLMKSLYLQAMQNVRIWL